MGYVTNSNWMGKGLGEGQKGQEGQKTQWQGGRGAEEAEEAGAPGLVRVHQRSNAESLAQRFQVSCPGDVNNPLSSRQQVEEVV